MYKQLKLSLACLFLCLLSCSTNPVDQKKPRLSSDAKKSANSIKKLSVDTLLYQSIPNGLASIQLKIIPSGIFNFRMRLIPQPMTSENRAELIESTGTWTAIDAHWIRLHFQEVLLDVEHLFDKETNKSVIKIIDKSTLALNLTSKELDIWGVRCQEVKASN